MVLLVGLAWIINGWWLSVDKLRKLNLIKNHKQREDGKNESDSFLVRFILSLLLIYHTSFVVYQYNIQ